ncbi:MAG: adenylate/guanylate cyclase domain-containing protein [Dongiaceae bacterium]
MAPSPGDEVRQRLTAILFADVVNYSGAMEQDQVGTHRRVMRRVNLFKSLIGDYEGHVFDVEGDAVKAAFDSAFQAVRFAVDLQREFRNDTVWTNDPDEPVFRIGINLGEVIVEKDGYYGHEVNVAERLQALAPPGGICVSGTVHRMVRGKLPIQMSPIGPQNLKNMAEPVEAYAVDLEGTAVPVAPPPAQVTPAPPEPTEFGSSIAVLPLRNLSGNPSDIHLCDGITSDITTNLSRFRDLHVIARHSAFFFRDTPKDLSEVGRQLGVRYALTGGLQRNQNQLSINVQVIETNSGRIMWSERYKGDLSDIFEFQDEITSVISARTASQVTTAELRRISSLPPSVLRAYGLVLRGQDLSLQFRRDTNLHARRLFEEAANMDPHYGRSYAGMSRTYNTAWLYRWADDPENSLDRAVHLAIEAVKRDDLDARGHSELGYAFLYKKRHDASLAAYERAVELNPNDADILADMGDALTYSDQPQRAITLLERAMRLNPLYPDWYLWHLGEAHFHVEDYEAAIRTLTQMRDHSEAHRLLAASNAHLGRMSEARQHAAEVVAVHPDFSIEHWRTVVPYSPEPMKRFIEGLRRAGLK